MTQHTHRTRPWLGLVVLALPTRLSSANATVRYLVVEAISFGPAGADFALLSTITPPADRSSSPAC